MSLINTCDTLEKYGQAQIPYTIQAAAYDAIEHHAGNTGSVQRVF